MEHTFHDTLKAQAAFSLRENGRVNSYYINDSTQSSLSYPRG